MADYPMMPSHYQGASYPGFSLPSNWTPPTDPLAALRGGSSGAMPNAEEQARALLPMLILKYLTPQSGESTYSVGGKDYSLGPQDIMPSQTDLGNGLSLMKMLDELGGLGGNNPKKQLEQAQAKYYTAQADKASRNVFDDPESLLAYLGNEDQKDEALLEKYRAAPMIDPTQLTQTEAYFSQRQQRRDEARRLAASGDTKGAWKLYGSQDMAAPAPQGGAAWDKYKQLLRPQQ